jgi:hypothetical protein
MARRPVPKDVQAAVLLASRRRCCVCFGLNRDTGLKTGQIAHIDRSSSNNMPDNLAFLCFVHHDAYDSKTSQSKNITEYEIKAFRSELTSALSLAFAQEIAFGEAVVTPEEMNQMIDGHYVRADDSGTSSAEIVISRIASRYRQYHVSGSALWGLQRQAGPNVGEFDLVMELRDQKFIPTGEAGVAEKHKINIIIEGDRLLVSEENWLGAYGMNVHFGGEYEKAK